MQKIFVENGDLDKALKIFQKISAESKRDALKHQYYLRPGLRRMEKSKNAQKRAAKKGR